MSVYAGESVYVCVCVCGSSVNGIFEGCVGSKSPVVVCLLWVFGDLSRALQK